MRPERPTKYDPMMWIAVAILALLLFELTVYLGIRTVKSMIPDYSQYNYCPEFEQPGVQQK
jgi:hypothetical protein